MDVNNSRSNRALQTDDQLFQLARRLVGELATVVGWDHLRTQGPSFDLLYEKVILPKYQIRLDETTELGFHSDGRQILGCFDADSNTAYVDRSIAKPTNDSRRAWTCYEEVCGHGVLQGPWLRDRCKLGCTIRSLSFGDEISAPLRGKLEEQARKFAGLVAAPQDLTVRIIERTFQTRGKPFVYTGHCEYMLDVRGKKVVIRVHSFDELCWQIASKVHHLFGGLSRQAIGIRLAQYRIVQDVTRRPFRLYRVAS